MRKRNPVVQHHAGRIAALTRSRTADDAELIDARRNLAEAKIATYVQSVLDSAPPLTDEQRTRLAELLRPVRTPAPDRKAVVAERLAELDGGDDHAA